jgi:hypothetical protein
MVRRAKPLAQFRRAVRVEPDDVDHEQILDAVEAFTKVLGDEFLDVFTHDDGALGGCGCGRPADDICYFGSLICLVIPTGVVDETAACTNRPDAWLFRQTAM